MADSLPLFPFSVENQPHGLVAAYLGLEKAVAVRSGHLCQFELSRQLTGTKDSSKILEEACSGNIKNMFGIVRASAGLTTILLEIDALALALEEFVSSGSKASYVQDSYGKYSISGWDPLLGQRLDRNWYRK